VQNQREIQETFLGIVREGADQANETAKFVERRKP